MTFTEKAQTIMDRGLSAFRNMRVRPEGGHTAIQNNMIEGGKGNQSFQFGCVVGAIAFEAATLQGLSDAQAETVEDDNAKKWVAQLFGTTLQETCDIERGFDAFFEVQGGTEGGACGCESCQEMRKGQQNTPEGYEKRMEREESEMFQVGYHVAKRATKHYMDLDEAETEAWEVYKEKGLKDYKPRKKLSLWKLPPRNSKGQFMSEADIDEAIEDVYARIEEECEDNDEECRKEIEELMPVA